eukprot:1727447-Pleurochrysis_carterae.AAC.1
MNYKYGREEGRRVTWQEEVHRVEPSKIRGWEPSSHVRSHKAHKSAKAHVRGARERGRRGKTAAGRRACDCAAQR